MISNNETSYVQTSHDEASYAQTSREEPSHENILNFSSRKRNLSDSSDSSDDEENSKHSKQNDDEISQVNCPDDIKKVINHVEKGSQQVLDFMEPSVEIARKYYEYDVAFKRNFLDKIEHPGENTCLMCPLHCTTMINKRIPRKRGKKNKSDFMLN